MFSSVGLLQFARAPRRLFSPLLRPRHKHTRRRRDKLPAAPAAAVISGGLLVVMVVDWERDTGEVRCESAAKGKPMATTMSSERTELRRVALAHLVKSAADRARHAPEKVVTCGQDALDEGERSRGGGDPGGTPAPVLGEGGDGAVEERGGDETQLLPPNVYDIDKILTKTPLLRNDNAFHDTLNSDDAIRCPYVLKRHGDEGEGIEAVVRFGKSIAGHPKIVHGGVTALTFDNLFGMALFLQNTGAVVTAFIKVDYKAPLPCLTTAIVDITVDRKEGRKLFVTGRLKSLDGAVTYSSAEALFIKPREAAPGVSGGAGDGSSGLLQGVVV